MYEYKKILKIFFFNKYCLEYLIDGFLMFLKINNCYEYLFNYLIDFKVSNV